MKTYSKIIAGALAVMLSAGATGMYAMANKKEDKKSDSDESKTSSAEKKVYLEFNIICSNLHF